MSKPTDKRPTVSKESIKFAKHLLDLKLEHRLYQKGESTWKSSHEILGIITEEYYELIDAVRCNDGHRIKEELLDVGVAALFAVACINNNKLDWL